MHALWASWQVSPELLAAVPNALSAMSGCPGDAGVAEQALQFLSNLCVEGVNRVRSIVGGGVVCMNAQIYWLVCSYICSYGDEARTKAQQGA